MRVVNKNETVKVEENTVAESFMDSFVSSEPIAHTSYHELSDKPVQEVDAIAQLHSNLEMLYDIQTRFSFVMREVRYLLKA
ncbi:hypothetical protein DOM22_14045 [Bdellovibrio sp. ZAP7]|uniref:hypothetical protein n=1 Tax=Bdellovibrio sp. ZAP7 TaxID=2231053 RepID=UPI0011587691|nr:hypothetical protein [Bdellovibrio sp. ZAP7]QDK46204.1 hypothetical protein DOM22_14045 [Bdellovibrio sp. ZAP7]